jgi:hypothetical protein
MFLERYNHIKVSWATVKTLLDLRYDLNEKIRAYIERFVKNVRNIENYSDKFIDIVQWGLRNGSPDILLSF